MKVLLVRLSSIGDVVHTLPAAAALRRAGHELGWLVEPAARSLVQGNPAVRHAHLAPSARRFSAGAAWALRAELRAARYDVALELQGLWKSAAWARLSGAARVVGYAGRFRREPASALLLGERHVLPDGLPHVIDKNLALLQALGVSAVGLREFPLPPLDEAGARIDRELEELGLGSFALLDPGGGWPSKLWPAESFGQLAGRLAARGLSSLVAWGPGEEALAEQVVAASGGGARRCFPTTLLELTALTRRARVVVAADTGPLHLACAVGAPVVGLFGPTDPARNGPFSAADLVLRRAPACAPCHRRACPTHAGVLAGITVEEVGQAVAERLRRAGEAA
jgi:ADP-heptose:LPS heptosyltransferase